MTMNTVKQDCILWLVPSRDPSSRNTPHTCSVYWWSSISSQWTCDFSQ